MNILNKISLTVGAICIGFAAFGQNPMVNDQARTGNNSQTQYVNDTWMPSLVEDGIVDRVPHKNTYVPIKKIREIDIAWQATVWRQIDINQKQNQAFRYRGDEYSGGGAFIEILNDAVKRGKVRAFSNVDDKYTTVLSPEEFKKVLGEGKDTTWRINIITGEEEPVFIDNQFNVNIVTQYMVKERWMFDRNRGRLIVQIEGLAPLKDVLDPTTGEYLDAAPMYWLHYPDLRKWLIDYEVYNPKNDLKRISWADFLDSHQYASYVVKTSLNNPLDMYLDDVNTPRALSEGQAILDNIIDMEMDMWQE